MKSYKYLAKKFNIHNKKICLVSHDSGGAEILSSLLNHVKIQAKCVLEGPAESIFKRKLGDISTYDLSDGLKEVDYLLCGTSWSSELELNALKEAKVLGIKSISFLDHWVNYRERFIDKSLTLTLPDQIWVGDKISKIICSREIPECSIFIHENPYYLDLKSMPIPRAESKKKSKYRVLYLTEPTSTHLQKKGVVDSQNLCIEKDQLDIFLNRLNNFKNFIEKVNIKYHPSETREKYNYFAGYKNLNVEILKEQQLEKAILNNDVVVGRSTMGLIVAKKLGRLTFSTLDLKELNSFLPNSKIKNINSFFDVLEKKQLR